MHFFFFFTFQVLKLYAWEEPFLSKIMRIRKNELKYLRNASCFNAIIEFTFTCAPFLVSLSGLFVVVVVVVVVFSYIFYIYLFSVFL